MAEYKTQLIGKEFRATTKGMKQVHAYEYKKWRRWLKTMEDKWEEVVLPVSIHAENIFRELKDKFATFYRRDPISLPSALMFFTFGILSALIAKVNKMEWDAENKK